MLWEHLANKIGLYVVVSLLFITFIQAYEPMINKSINYFILICLILGVSCFTQNFSQRDTSVSRTEGYLVYSGFAPFNFFSVSLWDTYKGIKLNKAPSREEPELGSAERNKSEEVMNGEEKQPQTPKKLAGASQQSLEIIYTRVPRTHGQHKVKLKNGKDYVLESPDIWDMLPDSRVKFSGFNAPGQLVHRKKDGTENILYDCFAEKSPCVPLDPSISLDGKRVLFSVYRGLKLRNGWWDRSTLPNKLLSKPTGAQLYVADLQTGEVKPLAHKTGNFDVSPIWLPDGQIMFASTRSVLYRPWLNGITPRGKEPQLYIADSDGTNARNISPHELATAMHPYLMSNGRVAYSSLWMSHNLAYIGTNGGVNWPTTIDNMWVVMDTDREGGDMAALLGAHRASIKGAGGRTKTMKALHFLGQRENNDVCVDNYYRANNLGLGDVFCWTPEASGVEGRLPNFLPRNIYSVATWSKSNDEPSWKVKGIYQGKIGYPEGINDNQLMLTVGRGYCTSVSGSVRSFQKSVAGQPEKRACDVGVYRTTRIPSRSMDDIIKIVDLPEWHEFGARVIKIREINEPPLVKSGDNRCLLASSDAGTAETSPRRTYKFNNNYKTSANNGGEIDGVSHEELKGIRFWEILPNRAKKRDFKNSIGNKLKLLGDAPLLKDKSFLVELPCDTPYIMAGIDSDGRVIKRDQVAQSLRPGEKRVCSGCHLHSRPGRPYEQSLAFGAEPIKLVVSKSTPTYEKDIQPIFQRRCASCHVDDVPLMDYKKLVWDYTQKHVPEERKLQVRKSTQPHRRYGLQRPYTSKYVNNMFARESLLYWKTVNQRTDGRTDETYSNDIDFGSDHPTGAIPIEIKAIGDWLDSGATK